MAITNYGREVAGTLTRRADSSPGWMQGGVVVGVLDLMGGKPGCAFGDGAVSPTLTRGRARQLALAAQHDSRKRCGRRW